MILHAPLGIHQVLALRHGEGGIVVIVQAPLHVKAVQAVFLNAQHGGLVRVVAQPEGGEDDLIEQPAFTV